MPEKPTVPTARHADNLEIFAGADMRDLPEPAVPAAVPVVAPVAQPAAVEIARARRRNLPFGSEFSPEIVTLPRVLKLLEPNEGNARALLDACIAEFFSTRTGDVETTAKNLPLSLIAYGIIDRDRTITPFGRELIALADDEPKLYARFARHILVNLGGLEVLDTIRDMQRARMKIDLTSLRKALDEHGLHMPRGGTHFSRMKQWLQKAGVIDDGYRIDEARVEEIVGTTVEALDGLAALPIPQQRFLQALVNLNPAGTVESNTVADYATRLYGIEYPDKSLAKLLQPIEEAGFVKTTKATGGRGARPTLVELTAEARKDYVEPLLRSLAASSGVRVKHLYQPLDEILRDVAVDDTYVKGRALEALAVHLCRILGLDFRFWRLRGRESGGAEVDAVLEGSRFIFSRWQIQCKNTATVRLDDVAKEVGIALPLLRSNIILIVSTGRVGRDARRYADTVMQRTNLQVILLDHDDLNALTVDLAQIVRMMDREALHAMDLKKLDDD